MTTVHVLEQDSAAPSGSAEGDYVVRASGGGDVEVGLVQHGGELQWLGSLPRDSVPGLEERDQTTLLIAVRGFHTAQVERGG